VSCASTGNCTAVGQLTNGLNDFGVVLTEVNGRWVTSQAAPNPTNVVAPYYATLAGVSCVHGHCSMVGQYQSSAGQPAHIVSY
jgi:hypothetical protein